MVRCLSHIRFYLGTRGDSRAPREPDETRLPPCVLQPPWTLYNETIEPKSSKKKTEFLFWMGAPVLVLLACLAVWSNHFESAFQDDDFHVIVNNRSIQDLANIPHFFTTPLLYADQPQYVEYRPLALVSFAVDYALATPINAGFFDIDSFAWFLLAVVIFGVLCVFIPGSNWRSALLAAGIFGLHPVAGETVNYASRRGDVIGATGLLAGFLMWVVWPRRLPREIMHWSGVPKKALDLFRKIWSPRVNAFWRKLIDAPLGLYLIPLVFGLLASPAVAVFPLLLLAYILLLDNGTGMKPVWRRVLPSGVICFVYWTAQLLWTWRYAVGFRQPSVAYWLTQPWVVLRYLGNAVVPVHLTAGSDLAVFPGLLSPLALAGIASLALLIVFAVMLGRHEAWRPVAFGIWWFLIALIPTIVIPQRTAESDTRMFVALMGFALAASRAGSIFYLRIAARGAERIFVNAAAIAVTMLALAALSTLTYLRAEVWNSETSFWQDVTEKSPRNAHAFIGYGAALSAEGLTDQGYDQLVHAAQLADKSGNNAQDQLDLSRAFDLLDKDKEAEAHFRRAVDIDPNYGPAWSGYSQWLMMRQRAREAEKAAQRAVRINPWNTEAQHTLMQYYSARSDWANLKKTGEAVLRVDPTDADGKRSVAVAQTAFDAVRDAEEKARSNPSADDFLALSVRYYQMRRFEDSVRACRDALKARPELGEAYSNMAAAYYALGKTDEAIKALRETIRIRPDLVMAKQNLDFLLSLRAEGAKPAPAAATP